MISVEMTEAEFVEQLLILDIEGKSFISGVYALLDKLTAEEIAKSGHRFACHEGCALCCHQMVVCTEIEWQAIQDCILAEMPFRARNELFRRARRALPTWRRWLARNQAKSQQDPTLIYRDWVGKQPCVFLDEKNRCSVYPVRTIDCRSVASDIQCTGFSGQSGMHRFVFPWHQWANNLILDEQKAQSKPFIGVTPLIHWLDILMAKMDKS